MADTFTNAAPPPALDVVVRPVLAQWLFDHDLNYQGFARLIGTTKETVRLLCLPFSAGDRRLIPSARLRAKIAAVTHGKVPPASFDAPSPGARPA